MHILLDISTHMDMPISIRMGDTPLGRLNMLLMELEIWPLSLARHLVVRLRSREWIRPVRGGRPALRALPDLRGEERDGGDEKGGEAVTNPIPIVGGKMKKRGWSISVRVVIRWVD